MVEEKPLWILQCRIHMRTVSQLQINSPNCQESWGGNHLLNSGRGNAQVSPLPPASSCYSSSLSWVERSLVWHTATSYTLSGIQNTWQGGKVHSANCSDITSKFLSGKMLVFLPYVMLLKQRYWNGTNNGHFIYHSFASIATHSCLLSVHLSSTDISVIADKLLPPYKNKEANKRH